MDEVEKIRLEICERIMKKHAEKEEEKRNQFKEKPKHEKKTNTKRSS
jgi:hypothetical protein